MAETLPFPDDLIQAQQRLHEAHAAYAALCRALPWSVEPLPGWPGTKHPHTDQVIGGREPSPGYTPEQEAEERRLWELIRELSVQVCTHPYWDSLDKGPARVDARSRLKHHPKAQPDAAGTTEAA
ncbi:hypothetical protein [Streptomyces sp. NPDC053431]|uniref:hypothetical protein n=1 Tax=Streptomyces sp. NPDC053431 TaxID=3365703 RepID=UPI0037D79946